MRQGSLEMESGLKDETPSGVESRDQLAADLTARPAKRKRAVRARRVMPIVVALTSSMLLITACEERLNAQGGMEFGGSTDTSNSDASSTEVSISDNEAESLAEDASVSTDTVRVTAESNNGTTVYHRSVQSVTVTSGADSSVQHAMVETACRVVHGEVPTVEDFYEKVGHLSLSVEQRGELGRSVQVLIDDMSAALASSDDAARAEVVVFCHTAQK
jgi:hypothetical protein